MKDGLDLKEINYCKKLVTKFKNEKSRTSLINKINKNGISKKSEEFLFELRFFRDLVKLGIKPDYEHKTGAGNSSVDFRIIYNGIEFFIELVTINQSTAVKNAHRKYKDKNEVEYVNFCLMSPNKNLYKKDCIYKKIEKQSEEGEIILVQQKIGEKIFNGSKIVKFPEVITNRFNIIIVNMRGYLDDGFKNLDYDYLEITYGKSGLNKFNIPAHCWENGNGKKEPIKGIFEKENPLKAAQYIQKRIHAIGFINENEFGPMKLLSNVFYCCNPYILKMGN
jgi:hypothetical protein